MTRRVTRIEKWDDINEVRLFSDSCPFRTITLIDGELEFNFPQSATMTKEQAAFIAAHIITLITT